MTILKRLTNDVHASKTNAVYAHTKNIHDAYEISGERTIPCLNCEIEITPIKSIIFFFFSQTQTYNKALYS